VAASLAALPSSVTRPAGAHLGSGTGEVLKVPVEAPESEPMALATNTKIPQEHTPNKVALPLTKAAAKVVKGILVQTAAKNITLQGANARETTVQAAVSQKTGSPNCRPTLEAVSGAKLPPSVEEKVAALVPVYKTENLAGKETEAAYDRQELKKKCKNPFCITVSFSFSEAV
jgi:hypothetical protein